ncbi:hypothetical protein GSI_09667 [Ganoderma sinense ZZ0214-1]|uniref:GST N-terminal domain-containing protein n=1 Tax=Ganoderma sinense ZZ0214-1 TaxID=1077348 RepID=A0A2G8S3A7_9APHY|nr:hypothetical protein GSI_09667 [Ganoderma sinense ZZ0214-1]
MSETPIITLYSAEESPFPHRVALALEEGNIPYDTIGFELLDKPDWYKEKVYPTAKVPYLVYGPKLQPGDAPSPDVPQLGESLVILEFLADAFPSAHLLPADPFLRAKARLFYRAVEEKFNPAVMAVFFKQAPKEDLYAAIKHIQDVLPPDTGFAVGEWSIADAAFLPIYLRALIVLELDHAVSQFAPGVAAEMLATLREAPRFARMQRYLEECMARPSAKKTWDLASVKAKWVRRLEFFLAQAQKQQQHSTPSSAPVSTRAPSRAKAKRRNSKVKPQELFVYDLQPSKIIRTTRPDTTVRETLFSVVLSTSGLVAGYQLPEKVKAKGFTAVKSLNRIDELKDHLVYLVCAVSQFGGTLPGPSQRHNKTSNRCINDYKSWI